MSERGEGALALRGRRENEQRKKKTARLLFSFIKCARACRGACAIHAAMRPASAGALLAALLLLLATSHRVVVVVAAAGDEDAGSSSLDETGDAAANAALLTASFRGSPPWRAVPDLWVARTATVACEGGQVSGGEGGWERGARALCACARPPPTPLFFFPSPPGNPSLSARISPSSPRRPPPSSPRPSPPPAPPGADGGGGRPRWGRARCARRSCLPRRRRGGCWCPAPRPRPPPGARCAAPPR